MRLKETEAVRPDLDDRIARADIIARDAELDLARAMTKQASEQAELRVAQAALNAAQARLDRSQRDVQRLEQELASLAETRSEEHTSELQSLMRISYAVFCLKKKTNRRYCTKDLY